MTGVSSVRYRFIDFKYRAGQRAAPSLSSHLPCLPLTVTGCLATDTINNMPVCVCGGGVWYVCVHSQACDNVCYSRSSLHPCCVIVLIISVIIGGTSLCMICSVLFFLGMFEPFFSSRQSTRGDLTDSAHGEQ